MHHCLEFTEGTSNSKGYFEAISMIQSESFKISLLLKIFFRNTKGALGLLYFIFIAFNLI